MSLARDLIDAALSADLSQNELRAFLALFRQTLCYGKTSDPLTMKRLAALTHIRVDHLPRAIGGVISKGLFMAQDHSIFGYEYSIPEEFLAKAGTDSYTPALPKNGKVPQEMGEFPEKWLHTSIYLTTNNLTTTPNPKNPSVDDEGQAPSRGRVDATQAQDATLQSLPYPIGFGSEGRKQAARILDGLTPDNARDCLLILAEGMKASKVKSPLGYLHNLAKSARQGTLDRSSLHTSTMPALTPPSTTESGLNATSKARMMELSSQIQGIDAMSKLMGKPLDTMGMTSRQALVNEFNAIKAGVAA